jgi:threonylcarbamoyladenosine tRNA methylthiotransferase MtaB
MRIAFRTFGCKLNQYETESLAHAFASPFFRIVAESQEADLYVVNSCAVTSKSEQKVRVYVRGLSKARPDALIIATGCYAQVNGSALEELSSNVVVIPQSKKDGIQELAKMLPHISRERVQGEDGLLPVLRSFAEGLESSQTDAFRYELNHFTYHSRAFLKIQDGCDYRCSYCLIPHARGPSVSLDTTLVLARAKDLENAGYREIVLTGVNIAAYRFGSRGLFEVVEALLGATAQCRFRLSSLEPETIDLELLEIIKDARICPHFHLPVQSGSNRILRSMNRRYQRERVLDAVEMLRQAKPDAFIGSDFIVGFPGETVDDFDDTIDLIDTMKPAKLHVFPYSPRPDTPANVLTGRVEDRIKKDRVRRLLSLSDQLLEIYTRKWQGRLLCAIIEGLDAGGGGAKGLSENYLKLIIDDLPAAGVSRGSLVQCRLDEPGNPSRARFHRAHKRS